jgi:hypothetical protein
MKQLSHARGGIGFPMPICQGAIELLTGRISSYEEMRLTSSFGVLGTDKSKIGPEGLSHLRNIGFQSRRERLAFSEEVCRVSKQVGQHMENPGASQAWRCRIGLPLIVSCTQSLGLRGITRFQALRENAKENRQRKEWTGYLNEGKPVCMVT